MGQGGLEKKQRKRKDMTGGGGSGRGRDRDRLSLSAAEAEAIKKEPKGELLKSVKRGGNWGRDLEWGLMKG